ncbi:MAG: DNA repair protein RadA/Sms, partial [Ilumatobacter sp.]
MAKSSGKIRIVYACSECGSSYPKWSGQCGSCGDWNTLAEEIQGPGDELKAPPPATNRPGPMLIGDVGTETGQPRSTHLDELDRVLGGGIVPGAVMLLGGEPGIGKSTLLLQLLASWDGPTLYVSAEESAQQVRVRAERLDAVRPQLWLHAETSLPHILESIEETKPELVVIDSIQTVFDPALGSLPGSVGQVRGCAQRLVNVAKERDIAIVLVGHVTKDGGL